MSSRNDRLFASMASLDEFVASFEDPTKIATLSDGGSGVERMLDAIDGPAEEEDGESAGKTLGEREMKLHTAKKRLYRAGLGHLVPVLVLIAKNGNNRKESIWQLMRK